MCFFEGISEARPFNFAIINAVVELRLKLRLELELGLR